MSSHQKTRQIVITGIGLISPIGNGAEAFHAALKSGVSGVGPLTSILKGVAYHGIGAEVADFDESSVKKLYFKEKEQKKSIKVMCREIQMGVASALMALEHSSLDLSTIDHARIGVDFGANLMYYPPTTLIEASLACVEAADSERKFDYRRWGTDGLKAMEPLWMLKYLPNMPACHIGIFTDSRGPNNSVTLDEASPGVALTEALNILERGAADMMIVGGTGTRLHGMKTVQTLMWDQLAYDADNPAASCKPFDTQRQGQVVGEAAGSLILEEEEHARARGARIYGRLLSGGSSCVGRRDGSVDVSQAVQNAVNIVLARADARLSDIGHINAHGLGTVNEDAAEAAAYHRLSEQQPIPVTGLKGHFGNCGAATGFLELVGSLLSLAEGQIPPTLNCTQPDPSLGLNVVTGSPRSTSNKLFINVNFTNLAQASAVLVEAV